MSSHPSSYRGYRFPPEIISHAVWLYHRFGLSFRDVEDLLAEPLPAWRSHEPLAHRPVSSSQLGGNHVLDWSHGVYRKTKDP